MTDEYEFDISLVDGKPPLNANQRLPWYVTRSRVAAVRNEVQWRIKRAKVQPAKHLTVGLHYRPAQNRTRDASNLMPTQKPAVDALVREGVVPDDSAEWVTEQLPYIHPADKALPPRLWLKVVVTA